MLKDVYRTARADTLPESIELKIGERTVRLEKSAALRYGENPHQAAAYYGAQKLQWLKDGKGGPSWTNLADLDQASKVLRFFHEPAAVVMKHLNPAGVAQGSQSLADIYRQARACDPRAAFGGVAVVNRTLDQATAEAILEGFVEVVAAPDFSPEALEVLGTKKDLRIASIAKPATMPRYLGDDSSLEIRVLGDGSVLVQEPFLSNVRSAEDLAHVPEVREPSPQELRDLLFAWYVAAGVRSNAVVLACQGRTLSVGTGQQERVGAVEQAIAKAQQKGHDLQGAVVSSDGFFPFRDSIDLLAAAGIRAIVQPGGSMRDSEVLQACKEHDMSMVFSEERCFGHF